MLTANALPEEFKVTNEGNVNTEKDKNVENQTLDDGSCCSSDSEMSLSEKIIMESNEKRLRKRINTLQLSIMDLKEQLKNEKELWLEDLHKIKQLTVNQENHICPMRYAQSKDSFSLGNRSSSSVFSLSSQYDYHIQQNHHLSRRQSIKYLLEAQDYKRKLAETENMCNLELLKVKQSLEDLKILQAIAREWGKLEENDEASCGISEKIEDIFISGHLQ